MTEASGLSADRAKELRRAFDSAFAAPIATSVRETIDLIGIRVGGNAYAVRSTDIAGLHSDVAITPLPGPLPELIGLAGFRGALIPVYDLAALLGYPGNGGRWMVRTKDRSVAFAFEELDAHFRIDAAGIARDASGSRHVTSVARSGDRTWPIIDLNSIVAALSERAANLAPKMEPHP